MVQWLRLHLPTQDSVRSLVMELRFHMPQGQKVKAWNRSKIVTNSMKTLNNGPH